MKTKTISLIFKRRLNSSWYVNKRTGFLLCGSGIRTFISKLPKKIRITISDMPFKNARTVEFGWRFYTILYKNRRISFQARVASYLYERHYDETKPYYLRISRVK